jgi:hypothetical protein
MTYPRDKCAICGREIASNCMTRHRREEHADPFPAATPATEPDRTGRYYIPTMLPCGKRINDGRKDQCCMTECPEKTSEEIIACYDEHKRSGKNV